jgi:glutathione synthase/RimK-type ligase-like ATP-grasp enzyme
LGAGARRHSKHATCGALLTVSRSYLDGQYALVVPRLTWDYQTKPKIFSSWMATVQDCSRLCNPPRTLAWSAHKSYLRDLDAAGIPVIPTIWILPGGEDRIGSQAASLGRQQALIKPAVGATSSGCMVFTVGEEVERARAHAAEQLNEQDSLLLQPFCADVMAEGEYSLMLWDGRLSHGVRKVPVAGEYRVQDDFGGTDEPWDPPAEVVEIALRAANMAPGGWTYARVDFLHDDSFGWCVLECEMVEPRLFFRRAPAEEVRRLAQSLHGLAAMPRCGARREERV